MITTYPRSGVITESIFAKPKNGTSWLNRSSGVLKVYEPTTPTMGILQYIGTVNGTTSFTAPHPSRVTITFNNTQTGAIANVVDKIDTTGVSWGNAATTANNWMRIQFLNNTVKVHSYTLTTHPTTVGNFLRAWELQGSNDGTNWTVLDSRSDDNFWGLNQRLYFVCNQMKDVYYSYIRLVLGNLNSSATRTMALGDIELFGAVTT